MESVLTWGNVGEEFKRLGITAEPAWSGHGWDDGDAMAVYELSDRDYKALCDDQGWDGAKAAWAWASGSNVNNETARFSINGHWITAFDGDFREEGDYSPKRRYDHLLQYLCDEIGASTCSNVTAVAGDLAKMNGLTLAQLFAKYQPRREEKRGGNR